MATEVQTLDPPSEGDRTTAGGSPQGLLAQIQALGAGRILALGAVTVALAAFFALVVARSLEQPYTLLFGGLAPEEARRIIERLEAGAVPYRLSPAGDALLVPADRALRLRLDLAEQGLPAGGSVGYEVFDRGGPLGTSDFLANVNLRRALEGELARTIAAIRSVRGARVHLVLPRRELFERDRHAASASVVLSLASPGGLERRQVQGIRNLVAAAVPGLDVSRITIVDDRGELLARGGEGAVGGSGGADLDEQRSALEQRLRGKILQLLERTIGPGRVEAEVTADLELDEVSTTAEQYDPNGQVARSTQTVEETGDRRDGEAGMLSVSNNLPTERNAQPAGPTAAERTSRTEETINYEISRTVRSQTRRPGQIRRLSIAVQVDGVTSIAPDGTRRQEPRSAEELAQLAALVRSAAGVDEERGDVVEVVSRPFVQPDIETAPESDPLALSREELTRLGELAGLAVLAVLVLLFGVRPLVRSLRPAPPAEPPAVPGDQPLLVTGSAGGGGETDAAPSPAQLEAGDAEAGAAPEARPLLEQLSGLVADRPEDAVRVIRTWLKQR